MLYDVISLLLPFLGFAVSLALSACCILLLIKHTQIVTSLLYLVLAISYSAVLFKSLARQSTGYVCALPQTNTMLLYLIVIVLFLFFIFDRVKLLRSLYSSGKQKGPY